MKPEDLAKRLAGNKGYPHVYQQAVWQMAARGEILCDVGLPRDMTVVTAAKAPPIVVPNKRWLFQFYFNLDARRILSPIDNYPSSRFWKK